VIAPQDQAIVREAVRVGETAYKGDEVGRGHARIAPELVDLIARSLNQKRRVRLLRVTHRRSKNIWMRRADGVDAQRLAAFLLADDHVKERAASVGRHG
jgi:hypothetical protein